MQYKKIKIIFSLSVLLILLMFSGVACNKQERQTLNFEELKSAKIGVVTGTSYDKLSKETFYNAEIIYFNNVSDMILGLEQGKIDAFIGDSFWFAAMRWDIATLDKYDDTISSVDNAFAFSDEAEEKGYLDEVNEFLRKSKENGYLTEVNNKWTSNKEPTNCPNPVDLPDINGRIKIVVSAYSRPLAYMKNNRAYGMNVEIIYKFAEEYGYALDVEIVGFEAILPGITSGKYDIAVSQINVTEERKEALNFSDSYAPSQIVAVRYNDLESEQGFFEGILESLEKTFVREQRWLMILNGIKITLIITFASLLLGLILGFAIYMLRRIFGTPVIKVMAVYSRIMSGTPIVVILMILYYVIFGKSDISGVIVAIIGFSLTCCSFVYENLTVSVDSIDSGQREAALANGFTKNGSFFNIVLPQAMKLFLPAFQGEAVSLCKATAIVGYVTVQDLTKATDIIRSNTYEAFFPLIATAIIYFLLTWGLASIVGAFKIKFNTRKRSAQKILKGVHVNDRNS